MRRRSIRKRFQFRIAGHRGRRANFHPIARFSDGNFYLLNRRFLPRFGCFLRCQCPVLNASPKRTQACPCFHALTVGVYGFGRVMKLHPPVEAAYTFVFRCFKTSISGICRRSPARLLVILLRCPSGCHASRLSSVTFRSIYRLAHLLLFPIRRYTLPSRRWVLSLSTAKRRSLFGKRSAALPGCPPVKISA